MLAKKAHRRRSIKFRVRKKIKGTAERPRLSVYRSNKEIYGQLIDDIAGHTLASFSSRKLKDSKGKTKKEVAAVVGEEIGKLAVEAGHKQIVFDRNGYLYHGRVREFAEGARKAGLIF